jgi:hypothetical protein
MTIGPGDERWGTGRSRRGSGYRTRSYYLPDHLHFRLRNAWWHTQARGDYDSLSALVAAALWPMVEELESRYNGGRPFPELPRGGRLAMGPRRRRSPGPGTAGSASPPSTHSGRQSGHVNVTTTTAAPTAPEGRVNRRGEAADVPVDRVSEFAGAYSHPATAELLGGGRTRKQVERSGGRQGPADVRPGDGEDLGRDDRHEEHGPRANGHRDRDPQVDHGKPGRHLHGAAASPHQRAHDEGVPQGTGGEA